MGKSEPNAVIALPLPLARYWTDSSSKVDHIITVCMIFLFPYIGFSLPFLPITF